MERKPVFGQADGIVNTSMRKPAVVKYCFLGRGHR